MKGYKVFNPDWTCRDKQYSCPGVFEQEGELKLCKNGIHFCKKLIDCFNYYEFNPKNKVAEIEAIGEIIESENEGKYCTSKIKIIRELNWYEVLDLVNIGVGNTGSGNSGNCNTGHYNTGHYNTGDCNAGIYNSGNRNAGGYNSGNWNTGYYNFGTHNSGHYNIGHNNSGDYNSGNFNSGDYNSGHYNTGDYNSGHRNFGCFNTKRNKNKMVFFDKQSDWTYGDWKMSKAKKILSRMKPKCLSWTFELECDITEEEKEEYKTINGFLKCREKEELYSLRQEWWNGLSKEDKEITGIDVTIEK